MALKKDISTVFGVDVANAYHRVQRIQIIEKTRIQFVLNAYKDENTAEYITSNQYACQYNLTGNNPIAQAYVFLKTLPEFAGATDC